jgi:hypothetical protein
MVVLERGVRCKNEILGLLLCFNCKMSVDKLINKIIKSLSLDEICISSKLHTKTWRKGQEWYTGGKKNECEKFQRALLEKGLGCEVLKTNIRLDVIEYNLKEETKPLTKRGGFKYTEDFDGTWENLGSVFYANFKMICDSGGAQTRSIREVYHFLICQHMYLLNNPGNNVYFVNIIDGDQGYKFTYKNFDENQASLNDIQLDEKFVDVIDRVYIGDMKNFWSWYNKLG